MSIAPSFAAGCAAGAHPVVAAVEAASAALDAALDGALDAAWDGAAGGAVWSLSDEDLLAVLEATERVAARLAGLGLRLVREADGRDLAARTGATSTAALLRHRLRLRPGEAKARVELAAAVEGDLAATGVALAAGEISGEQARAVHRAVVDLPAQTPPATAREAERTLLGHAATFDPGELARLGAHLRHLLRAEDLAEREERAVQRRELTVLAHHDGTHRVRGILDDEAAARLLTALDPLAAPRPADDGTPDPRSAARRRADALVDLAGRALDTGGLPATGGVRPHITIVAPIETLLGQPAVAADTDLGVPVSAQTLRRLCCDGSITRVLLDPAGVPLDVGRESRLVTPGLRRALIARDRCCTFPGCDRPPSWCVAHHLVFWADGGTTTLQNLALLCNAHHTLIHRGEWTARLGPHGLPEYVPPPWIDPQRKPRRNPYTRRPHDLLHDRAAQRPAA
jgi:Domain of unknown function (DUF222)